MYSQKLNSSGSFCPSKEKQFLLLLKLFCSRFVCNGEKNFTIVRIKTNRPIEVGEEVTVSYADDYFQIESASARIAMIGQSLNMLVWKSHLIKDH